MGLFGGKKTYVTSVVYNLAGDIEDRPNYLKSLVIRNTLYGTDDMTQTLHDGYVYGPGIKLRSFGRWSQGEYSTAIGASRGSLPAPNSLDVADVSDVISDSLGGTEIAIQQIQLDFPTPDWWADRWILENHPDQIDTDYQSDFDETTGEIIILMADGTTMYSFTPTDYDPKEKYIYVVYNTATVVHHDAIPAIPGDPEADPPTEDVPEVPAWDEWTYGGLSIFLYKIGSGNAVLDAMVVPDVDDGFYFPVIPIRIDNKFVGPDKDQWNIKDDVGEDPTDDEIDDAFEANKDALPEDDLPINYPDIYPLAKRALKKATGGKFGDVTDSLTKNVSLEDIDYAYIVFGACINSKENAARLYLWRFFERLVETQGTYDPEIWTAMLDIFSAKMAIWKDWVNGGKVGPEPEKPLLPDLLTQWIRVYAQGASAVNYDVIINWTAMAKNSGSGLGKAGAKKGDVWWEVDADLDYEEILYHGETTTVVPKKMEQVTIYFQEEDNSWRAITIWDLVHRNQIYNGKEVEISAKQAILSLDDDGNSIPYEESGFIVPLHYDTFRDMPLIRSTQMSTACCYLVINCYKVVKQKWYQTGIFAVFLIVVIVAVTVATGGIGGVGILGSNLAVGSALGFTGTAAALVGGIANAIAAMLILKAIGMVSTAVLGDKFGAIIGAIAGVVAISVGVGLVNGGSLSASIGQLARPEGLMKLTDATVNGYAAYVKGSIKQMQSELTELKTSTNDQLEEVQDLYEKNIGYDRASLDPALFGQRDLYVPEAGSAFLTRTLMTGSDMIEFSLSLIHDFSALTLSTDLPS